MGSVPIVNHLTLTISSNLLGLARFTYLCSTLTSVGFHDTTIMIIFLQLPADVAGLL